MRKFIILVFCTLFFSSLNAEQNLKYFIIKAIDNNLTLNAERKKLELLQDKNVSRSEFLPSITINGDQTSSTTTNRVDQSGSSLTDTNLDTENKIISLEQKVFSGFKALNTFKKTELETQKAVLELKQVEQQTIIDTAFAYYDLIYKSKSEKFNLSNVNLLERQVEFDNARLQKGEITLTDLAQSESSLAGANASLIKAKTEMTVSITNFERVTREKIPNLDLLSEKIILDLPTSLNSSLEYQNLIM